jgi:hypothetical protein
MCLEGRTSSSGRRHPGWYGRAIVRAVVVGSLVGPMIAVAPVALATDGVERSRTAPASASVLDTASLIIGVWGAVKQCVSEASAGSWFDCAIGSFSGPTIQDVLNRIDALERKIDQNHAEVMTRLGMLENAIKQAGLQDQLVELKRLGNNGDDAMEAWQALTTCLQVQSDGGVQCADYTGTQRPVRQAIRDNSDRFLLLVDRWKDLDLQTLASDFAGGGGRQGIADAAWDYFRSRQNNEAGVSGSSPVRASTKVPVVTHALSTQMNSILEYYANVISRYALLSAMADGIRNASQLNCGSTPLQECRENRIRAWQFDSSRWISGTDRRQVAGAVTYYSMPVVPEGAIAVSNSDGSSRFIAHAGSGGSEPLSSDSVRRLASRLNSYSSVSKVVGAYPGSFPVDHWYVAQTPIIEAEFEFDLCGGCGQRFMRDIMMSVPVPEPISRQTCSVRVRPVDEAVPWDSRYPRQVRFASPITAQARQVFAFYAMVRDTFDFFRPYLSIGANQAIEYEWQTHTMDDGERRNVSFGWGGDVRCSSGTPSTKDKVPAGQYPLWGV